MGDGLIPYLFIIMREFLADFCIIVVIVGGICRYECYFNQWNIKLNKNLPIIVIVFLIDFTI